MEILTLLSATATANEPYGNVIITIIGISYIFKLILEITKKMIKNDFPRLTNH